MPNLNLKNLLFFSIIVLFSLNTNANNNSSNINIKFRSQQQSQENKNAEIPELFIKGVKDSFETISSLYVSIIFIGILMEQKLITYNDNLFDNISNFWLKHIVNIIFLSLLIPLIENIISHSIVYSISEQIYQKITPETLNNKNIDANIPRIRFNDMPTIQEKLNSWYQQIKMEATYNPKSSSIAVDFFSKLTLGTVYLLVHLLNKGFFSGIIRTISAFKRTPYYKTHGYNGAVAYQAGFNTCLYINFAICMFLGLNFINYLVR